MKKVPIFIFMHDKTSTKSNNVTNYNDTGNERLFTTKTGIAPDLYTKL